MRVLLTGSSGWLGRTLAPLLTENGHAVTGLDVVPGTHTQVIGTVADRTLIDRTMGEHGIEAIIHGGALHKPDIVRYPRQAFIDVNVTGTLNLIEAAVAAASREPSAFLTVLAWPSTCRPDGSPPRPAIRPFIAAMAPAGSRIAGPHGIQPEPNLASRRATASLTVPLTQIGTPPD